MRAAADVERVRQNRGYRALVAVGLVSYGLVHLLIAYLAVRVALGGGGDTSSAGALSQIAKQPLGRVLLWVMAAGLFTLMVWQVVEATIGRTQGDRDSRARRRLASAGRAVVYLAIGALAVTAALGGGSHSGQGEETLSARLLKLSFGRALVIAVGVAVLAVGISQIVKGVKQNFTEDLDQGVSPTIRRLGTIGYCAKGISLLVIGGLFGWAAVTYDAKKAGGMDAALTTIRDQPFGEILLLVMAAGIACFGLFCFAWARKARF